MFILRCAEVPVHTLLDLFYCNRVKQCSKEVRSRLSVKESFSSISGRADRHINHMGIQSLANWTKVHERNQATGLRHLKIPLHKTGLTKESGASNGKSGSINLGERRSRAMAGTGRENKKSCLFYGIVLRTK